MTTNLLSVIEQQHKALKLAVTQNSHDMLMTGEELRKCEAALAAAQQALEQTQVEVIAWEATTPGYINYVTDTQYRSYSETAKRHYKPYKCSSCHPQATEPAPSTPLSKFVKSSTAEREAIGNVIVEQADAEIAKLTAPSTERERMETLSAMAREQLSGQAIVYDTASGLMKSVSKPALISAVEPSYAQIQLIAELRGRRSHKTDAQVHDLAEKAGFKWIEPDDEEGGFPGGFDMSDFSNMRKLVDSLTIQCTWCDGVGKTEEGDEEAGSVIEVCDRCGGSGQAAALLSAPALPAAAMPVGELTDSDIRKIWSDICAEWADKGGNPYLKYARAILAAASTQPVREPLTDAEINDLCSDFHEWSEWGEDYFKKQWFKLARDIEEAYGITKKGGE